MEEKYLHSRQLEKLAGSISCEIVLQQDDYRKVHLRDINGISRTLGLVRFYPVRGGDLHKAHSKIVAGGMLGLTLSQSGITFDKEYISSFEMELPDWLKAEFSTDTPLGLVLHSRIQVAGRAGDSRQPYAEVLEVIPPDLRQHFAHKAPLKQDIPPAFNDLLEFGQCAQPSSKNESRKRCIVVGAGPGGLVAVKELLEQGIDSVLCLEQADEIGGTFARSYDNLILTSSVTFSMYSDFWVGEGKDHHFWSKEEAITYWTDYAKHFGVLRHVRLGTRVTQVTDTGSGSWKLQLGSGETLVCEHLILAIGNNNIPRYPDWSGQLTEVAYSHSRDYKNALPYKGKRVLVVGGGESGSDVAYEISQVASQSWVSLRESSGWIVPRRRGGHAADVSTHRGIWDLPRDYGKILSPFVLKLERARQDPVFDALADLNEKIRAERGIWGIYGTKTLALPKAVAHHGCKVVGAITKVEQGGRKLTASTGETIVDLDAVVFSTGYVNRVGFMPDSLQSCDPRKMYKHLIHPEYGDRMAWIGWARPGFGSQFPIMEMQARYTALLLSGKMELPSKAEMGASIERDFQAYKEQFEENAERIRSLVDYHRYMNDMAGMLGCNPPLMQYFFLRPRLWLHLMYGPTQATQFRLRGPGAKRKMAHEIIRKLPISTYNHIVKAGLRGRIRYGLGGILPKRKRPATTVGVEGV